MRRVNIKRLSLSVLVLAFAGYWMLRWWAMFAVYRGDIIAARPILFWAGGVALLFGLGALAERRIVPKAPTARHAGAVLLIVSILVFAAAVVTPALFFAHESPIFGLKLLLLGWAGVAFGEFAWLANPLFVAAWLLFAVGQARTARFMALGSVCLASLTFLSRGWYFDESGPTPIDHFGPGFFLWLSSFAAFYLGALLKRKTPNQTLEPPRVLGTLAAEPPRVPSTRVAHL